MSYYTLIASLPHLPAHFDVERPPISRPRLEERLKLLEDNDSRTLEQLSNFLEWDRQSLDRTDAEVVSDYERLMNNIINPLIQELVNHRMDIRTIVSGLRRRHQGDGPPIGIGRLVDTIRRNWNQPQFNLQRRFPWIEEFDANRLSGKAVAAERVLFEATWQTWSRLAAEFTFSFEAVLLYLARWAIVDRWVSRNADTGRVRFETLIEETMGEYASLQF